MGSYLALQWVILVGIALPFTIAELVVKSDGMLSMRKASGSCNLPKYSESAVHHLNGEEVQSLVPRDSGTCGRHNKRRSLRISGGDIYPKDEYPFISALVKCSNGCHCQPFCGGSIISRSHILTAAHCTDDLGSAKLFVLVGAYEIFSNQSCPSIQVRSITQHPAYDRRTLMNDIAVLTLNSPITFSAKVGPVCLSQSDIGEGQVVKILGWGADRYHGSMSTKPKEMTTKVFSTAACAKQWGTCVRPTKPIQICTWSRDATPCQGDSGGPVVWLNPHSDQFTLVGVVSFGPQCTEARASVHTRVAAFLHWIQQQVQ